MHHSIQKIRGNIQRLGKFIYLIPEQILLEKADPGKWSKKEILGHLVDSALYNLMRFNEIVAQKEVYTVVSYQQDELVNSNHYQEKELSALVILWQSLNQQIVQVVEHLSEFDLKKPVKVNGEQQTLAWLIDDYVVHMEHHLAQILTFDEQVLRSIPYQITATQAIEQLDKVPTEFVKLLEFGDLEIEYYRPDKVDKQQPHDKDELYIIISGQGQFIRENDVYDVQKHDVLFVKAREMHRFVNFSDDFATWVIFYGLKR